MSVTPMMQQYNRIKEQYPDAILFFRLGDFYEMFGDDAIVASKVLDIALTSRDAGKKDRIPMCGVPHHAATGYLATLIKNGFKVAVCEQLEDPKQAKGVVKRDVVRVITPSTFIEGETDSKTNTYLAAISSDQALKEMSIALVDLSTGEFKVAGFDSVEQLRNELIRVQPAEIIFPERLSELEILNDLTRILGCSVTELDNRQDNFILCRNTLLEHFQVHSLMAYGLDDRSNEHRTSIKAAGLALQYIMDTQRNSIKHIAKISTYSQNDYLEIDGASQRSLELIRTSIEGRKQGSLLGVLDRTVTSMGGRMLRSWIEKPLIKQEQILWRQEAVTELVNSTEFRLELREVLTGCLDLERILSRLTIGSGNARDLVSLKQSLKRIPIVRQLIQGRTASLFKDLYQKLDEVSDLVDLIERAIVDEPPISVKEGHLIKKGFHEELDSLRTASKEGKNWIAALESAEREKTGIKSLKVGFNKVFGYYIEVTKANIHNVPESYERKQTLANAERFITPELKEKESLILGAEERITSIEYELFCQIREQVRDYIEPIQQNAYCLAMLDVLQSLSSVAVEEGYCCPVLSNDLVLNIKEGRHPVIETMQNDFVPNDLSLDEEQRVILLTGPNMAGKSTFLRQVALIVIMAQIGSYVPATEAQIGIVDKIFTRIGAADDLSTGQSTFMVECSETANLLLNSTEKSLIILDELGRGTSTFDGMAIAQAVIEHIHNSIGSRTLFSTHYHELTKLQETLEKLATFRMEVKEQDGQIYFLHKVVPGNADRSYGINVARMAGIPKGILKRAQELLLKLEIKQQKPYQLNLFTNSAVNEEVATSSEVLDEIQELDINALTPLEALNLIAKWKEEI
ncbi:MAG: DNA mismatch repair protein MutS [Firmicutes bacterium]|nr:DNA mismatch repair protein MutS [Bacillota bacterium]